MIIKILAVKILLYYTVPAGSPRLAGYLKTTEIQVRETTGFKEGLFHSDKNISFKREVVQLMQYIFVTNIWRYFLLVIDSILLT